MRYLNRRAKMENNSMASHRRTRRNAAAAAQHDEETFVKCQEVMLDMHAPEEEIEKAITLCEVMFAATPSEQIPEVLSRDWAFWKKTFRRVKQATDKEKLVEASRHALGEEHASIQPPHNVAQFMMKATIHLIWRRLLEQKWGWDLPHRAFQDPAGAVQEVMVGGYKNLAQKVNREELFPLIRPPPSPSPADAREGADASRAQA